MAFSFKSDADVIIVRAALFGPTAIVGLHLVLDTGSTKTVISRELMQEAGYDLTRPLAQMSVATGSRIESLPLFQISSLMGLDQIRDQFVVIAHDLPASAIVDGVLGLDFLRNHRLSLDFRSGEIELI